MKRIVMTLVASTIGLSGAFSPAQAFQYSPIQCQPGMDNIIYYSDNVSFNPIVGEDVTYCDSHEIFLGRPEAYSYTQYCQCT